MEGHCFYINLTSRSTNCPFFGRIICWNNMSNACDLVGIYYRSYVPLDCISFSHLIFDVLYLSGGSISNLSTFKGRGKAAYTPHSPNLNCQITFCMWFLFHLDIKWVNNGLRVCVYCLEVEWKQICYVIDVVGREETVFLLKILLQHQNHQDQTPYTLDIWSSHPLDCISWKLIQI